MENNKVFRNYLFEDRLQAHLMCEFFTCIGPLKIRDTFGINAVSEIYTAVHNLRSNTFIHNFEYDNLNLLLLYYNAYEHDKKSTSRTDNRNLSSYHI